MSHQAFNLVRDRQWGSAGRKATALLLADRCNATWSCWIGQERLAAEAEVTERSVRSYLASFEAAGLIRRSRRYDRSGHRTTDRIELIPAAIQNLPAAFSGRDDLPETGASLPETGASLPETGARPTGNSFAGEPPGEPVEPPPRTSRPTPPPRGRHPSPAEGARDPDDLELTADEAPAGDLWAAFWQAYPRRVGKKAAREAWNAALRAGSAPTAIVAGAERYAVERAGEHQRYTPHPATWLRDGRWEDEPTEPAKSRNEAVLEAWAARSAG